VYLACKVEEFNLTITQFVSNIKDEPAKWTEIIINNELMLMETIKFHLIIHNPYLARDAFLEDMKGKAQELQLSFDPTTLSPHIDHFLEVVLLTDVPLLYTHSQVSTC
jgi:cyclin H